MKNYTSWSSSKVLNSKLDISRYIILLPIGSNESMVHQKWVHCPASSFCTISQFLWEKNAKGEIWTSWLTGGHEAFHIQKHTFSRAGRKDTNSGVNENWTQTGAGRKDATTSLLQKAPLPLHQMNGGMGTCRSKRCKYRICRSKGLVGCHSELAMSWCGG